MQKKQAAVYPVIKEMRWFTCWNFHMLIKILKASNNRVPTCLQGIWKMWQVLLQPFELPAPFTWHFFRRQPFDQPQKNRFPARQSDWLSERASWDAINQQFLWIILWWFPWKKISIIMSVILTAAAAAGTAQTLLHANKLLPICTQFKH